MSIPLDRLYHYIQDVAEQVYGEHVLIYRFTPHGSKKIEDLDALVPIESVVDFVIRPQIYCYDQEPLDYDFYQDSNYSISAARHREQYHTELKLFHGYNLRTRPKNIYDKCLLLHSEQKSNDVEKYSKSHFIPVYYWSHALIALDWFRYAKFVDIKPKHKQKLFLVYNRAWAGTREYRIKFTELLEKNNLLNDCQTSFNAIDPEHDTHYTEHTFKNINFKSVINLDLFSSTIAPNTSSADFNIDDYSNTKFEVVLETLFDDNRIQLTEKVLRPIACGHPFMLASTPGSLEYLRNYGFKTFDGIINEGYDNEQDPLKRLDLIIHEMKKIINWTSEEKISNWDKIKKITNYNKKYFFSDTFFKLIVNELKNNLLPAFTELENTNTSRIYINQRIATYNLPELDRDVEICNLKKDMHTQSIILQTARRYYNHWRNNTTT
jgi:hypothetical protein